ncbi:CopD family protein [Halocatena halophila]|uniref:CopD family protein n=1 Tax=Halocatena halophila TaxID=2814576 RepID=UPI002ED0F023
MILELVLAVHTIVAALWTGATVFIAGAIIPAAKSEQFGSAALSIITRRYRYLTIGSVLLLLFSGGHLAGTLYTFETLQGSGRGHLVLAMVVLWLVLAHLAVFGYRKLTATDDESVAEAATAARPLFYAGSVVSVLLLIVAGLL